MSPIVFTLIYFLCIVMCLAVGTMLTWHLWGVAVGETAVESHDHEHYQRVAESRGEAFQNSYDLGFALPPLRSYLLLTRFQKTQESSTLF
jgi:hypothetical protein